MKEEQIIAKIKEVFKDELQGMTGNDHELVVMLKDKEVVIKNHLEKTPEEVIEEITEKINK